MTPRGGDKAGRKVGVGINATRLGEAIVVQWVTLSSQWNSVMQ